MSGLLNQLRQRLIDVSPGSRGNKYRARRFAEFLVLVDAVLLRQPECRILDIGGTAAFWHTFAEDIGARPLKITMVNLQAYPTSDPRFVSIVGDARDLSQYGDDSFDIVHSNSVIEHVGTWRDMKAMAGEVARLAPSYFIQTPYYWFPIEAHARFPLFNMLPEPIRLRLVMRKGLGFWPKARNVDEGMALIESARPLDRTMFLSLFPDARIAHEKAFGLTKSLMAIRAAR